MHPEIRRIRDEARKEQMLSSRTTSWPHSLSMPIYVSKCRAVPGRACWARAARRAAPCTESCCARASPPRESCGAWWQAGPCLVPALPLAYSSLPPQVPLPHHTQHSCEGHRRCTELQVLEYRTTGGWPGYIPGQKAIPGRASQLRWPTKRHRGRQHCMPCRTQAHHPREDLEWWRAGRALPLPLAYSSLSCTRCLTTL